MRVLLLLRGAPGCGKSTFIDNNGLRPYALSADEIRLRCQAPQLTINGKTSISQSNEKDVWAILFKMLEIRMSKGEFTVIDATNSKTAEMNRYKELCDQYRYRMFCVDLTDLPIEECKRRNAQRDEYKQVPEDVIDKMYSRFANQRIPSGIKVIKPEDLNTIWMRQFDMSHYEKIVHIGDIHGCYTALMEYLKDGLNDNYMYIFCGDLIDRGIENAEVVKFMIEIINRPNVLVLEGNHERWLWIYANDGISKSREFEINTKEQLRGIPTKDIRQLYRKFGQCAWYKYDDKNILVTHGGLSTMPENLSLIASEQMIKGVGRYDDFETIADAWMNTTPDNYYQIHGHRNTRDSEIKVRDRVFNLEGKVEFGGYLRIVELSHDGFKEVMIKNNKFRDPEITETKTVTSNKSNDEIVAELKSNAFIREKTIGNNISSFNFTKDAFYDKVWNEQTILARGLYIDMDTNKVIARGFNKFFNINERPETKLNMLQYKLQFPVTCYVKENGFLGLVSYNPKTDDIFITTKSDPNGDFAGWLRENIYNIMSADNINKMKDICKNENVTFIFECVDMKNDPHIIEYSNNELFLLAIVKNDLTFIQYDYDNVVHIANELNLKYKIKAYEIGSWSEFYDWYNEVTDPDFEYDGRKIEGFVIEDSNGYMVKAKLHFYKFWKHMRSVAQTTLRAGYYHKTGSLDSAEANRFYAFCQKLYNETEPEQRELIPRNIIYLRNLYLK